jgi:hypothetical protein
MPNLNTWQNVHNMVFNIILWFLTWSRAKLYEGAKNEEIAEIMGTYVDCGVGF